MNADPRGVVGKANGGASVFIRVHLWFHRAGAIFLDAERLIALEAALAELGGLYTAARNFTALAEAAEIELLPQLSTLSAHLRALNRSNRMAQSDIDVASRQILDLRASWQKHLDSVRSSSTYREAVEGLQRDDQPALAVLIPKVFALVRAIEPPPRLYFGVSAAVRRRGPGTSPFLSPEACADKIETTMRDGLVPVMHGGEFWDDDLPSIPCASSFADVDSPFALTTAGTELGATAFTDDGDLGYRIFTRRLTGEFAVEIAAEADDEWWQAFEQSYREFREDLCAQLTQRAIDYTVLGPS